MIRLRKAGWADCEDIWRWRNDPETRAASKSTAAVSLADHGAWYRKALADPRRTQIIAEDAEGKLGVVRFDAIERAEVLVGINLNPAVRGRGLAREILGLACEQFAAWNRPTAFLAEIRPSNARSIRIFESTGFARTECDDPEFLLFRRPATTREP